MSFGELGLREFLIFVCGYSVAMLIAELGEMRRIRIAVEKFADDFAREVKK